jgi:hypothetical protein
VRRRPKAHYPHAEGPVLDLASPPGPNPPAIPTTAGDALEPFICSGGQPFFPTGYPTDPKPNGVQLIATQYVPPGRVAWIKRLEVAPCAPAVLVDPWRGWPGTFNWFPTLAPTLLDPMRPPAQAGLWETPLGWESFVGIHPEAGAVVPFWRWSITLLNGSIGAARAAKNIPPFSPLDPASWYLAENMPVPRVAYAGGIPGRSPNGSLSAQRYQATPGNALPMHVLCPEDTTICLWAEWRQIPVTPLAFTANGVLAPWSGSEPALPDVYPLLPSVGRMLGYQQAATRAAALENAAHGWGG